MTDEQAGIEALRRWGYKAITQRSPASLFPSGELVKVGKRKILPNGGDFVAILGIAETWEEAFAQADRYETRAIQDAQRTTGEP
jgi:hypothetical protein